MSSPNKKSWLSKMFGSETAMPRADVTQAERARRFSEGTERAPMLAEPATSVLPYTDDTMIAPADLTYDQVITAANLASSRGGTPDDWTFQMPSGITSGAALSNSGGAFMESASWATSQYRVDIQRAYEQSIITGASTLYRDTSSWYSTGRNYIVPIVYPKRFKITVNTRRKWD